jgi:hypothetical protein
MLANSHKSQSESSNNTAFTRLVRRIGLGTASTWAHRKWWRLVRAGSGLALQDASAPSCARCFSSVPSATTSERAGEGRKPRTLACNAWKKGAIGYRGPAQLRSGTRSAAATCALRLAARECDTHQNGLNSDVFKVERDTIRNLALPPAIFPRSGRGRRSHGEKVSAS